MTTPALSPATPVGIAEVAAPADWRDWWALLKPRVMSLVVFTGACGLIAAPGALHPVLALTAVLCIAVGGGAAGALNQWYEAELDGAMKRTAGRPLPSGRIARAEALAFALILATGAVAVLGVAVSWPAAALLAFTILFYAVFYTMWLKPRTPHNIVIGGAAGAFPPVIGWLAVTGDVTLLPLILFAIIVLWTPPHFWALALFVNADYARAGVPMLTVTHGPAETRRQILIYSVALAVVSIAPWPLGLLGPVYGVAAVALGGAFIALAVRSWRNTATAPAAMGPEKKLFAFSILYLFALFGAVAVDTWVAG